jgi:hypothetical protein
MLTKGIPIITTNVPAAKLVPGKGLTIGKGLGVEAGSRKRTRLSQGKRLRAARFLTVAVRCEIPSPFAKLAPNPDCKEGHSNELAETGHARDAGLDRGQRRAFLGCPRS